MRHLSGKWAAIFGSIAVLWCLFHLYTSIQGAFHPIVHRAIFVGFGLLMCFALYPSSKKKLDQHRPEILDFIFMAVGMAVVIYAIVNAETFMILIAQPIPRDLVMSAIGLVVLLEAGRRTLGFFLPVMVILGFLYGRFGPYLPGIFKHYPLGWEMMLDMAYRTDLGMWGRITGIGSTVVTVFIIFGAMLIVTGAGDTFRELALKIAGRYRGGAAQTATVMSGLFGTLSGSAGANVATTGVFTIPMMKKLGYKPAFAGAVEACASSGGQLMPPIMGAGAFLMAEITGIPYLKICLAALVPALLFYGTVWMSIYFESRRMNLAPVPRELLSSWRDILPYNRSLPLFVPIGILLYLILSGHSLPYSCFWSIVSALAIYIITNPKQIAQLPAKLWYGFNSAMRTLVIVCVICAVANIFVGLVAQTGLGVALSELIMSASRASLILALILSAVVALILGMGMPTVGAYAIGTAVLSAALLMLGLPLLPAHLFIFYCALLSGITPPIAACVFVALPIAESKFWETAWASCRLGIALFFLPFAFTSSYALLLGVTDASPLLPLIRVIFAIVFLSSGSMGCFLTSLNRWHRAVLVIAGIMLIIPHSWLNPIGLVMGLAPITWQIVGHRRQRVLERVE